MERELVAAIECTEIVFIFEFNFVPFEESRDLIVDMA
jgi:hypothetical protein